MHAEGKDKFECSCIGARNKEVLKSALVFEKRSFEVLKDGLVKELGTISKFEIDESYPADFKAKRIKHVNKQINAVIDDINHIDNFINIVSEIEICGD